jgi:hypothetical protein
MLGTWKTIATELDQNQLANMTNTMFRLEVYRKQHAA